MNKKCTKCNDHFSSDGELVCTKCRVSSYDFTTSKRDFSKNIKAWNKYANEELHKIAISNKYTNKPIVRHTERIVDSNLNIHSSQI